MLSNLFLRNSASGDDRNLCFTNAVVQILRNVPSFKTKCSENSQYGIHGDLLHILNFEGTNKTVSAHPLRRAIGLICDREDISDGSQNDALEFCGYVLQNLHPSLSSIFRFKSKTEFKFWINNKPSSCQNCGRAPNDVNDEHNVFKLSFPNEDRLHLYQNGINLQTLINEHFELKSQSDNLKCENCCPQNDGHEHGPKCKPKPFITKEHIIQHPKFLIVQLLRFKQMPSGIQKIETKVTNIQSLQIQTTDYELISILNHEGGYTNGHYTALLKADKWYLCNDIKKSILRDDQIESEKNYAYIFKKKEPDMSGSYFSDSNQPRPNQPNSNMHSTNPSKSNQPKSNQPKSSQSKSSRYEFDLTDEWQYFPPGTPIPGKFDVDMQDDTGLKRARKVSTKTTKDDYIELKLKLDGNSPVPVGILNLASRNFWKILRKNGIYGSIPPSAILDYMKFNAKFSTSLTVPKNESGLNIHLLENNDEIHYVVSQKL